MTFQSQLATDFKQLLSNSEFEEVITYLPHGGVARTIRAIVTVRGQFTSGEMMQINDQTIEVEVSSDQSDATTGGVTKPQKKDAIIRTGISDTTRYAWTGAILDGTTKDNWVLEFERKDPVQAGKQQ